MTLRNAIRMPLVRRSTYAEALARLDTARAVIAVQDAALSTQRDLIAVMAGSLPRLVDETVRVQSAQHATLLALRDDLRNELVAAVRAELEYDALIIPPAPEIAS